MHSYLLEEVERRANATDFHEDFGGIDDFAQFGERDGWAALIPSTSVLKKAYKDKTKEDEELKVRSIMGITGRILCGDHTFAISKVPKSQNERIFGAMYSICNEFNQVGGFWMTHSKSMEEIRPELTAVQQRYEDGSGPDLFYTDNCCADRRMLTSVFPTLAAGVKPICRFTGSVTVAKSPEEVRID